MDNEDDYKQKNETDQNNYTSNDPCIMYLSNDCPHTDTHTDPTTHNNDLMLKEGNFSTDNDGPTFQGRRPSSSASCQTTHNGSASSELRLLSDATRSLNNSFVSPGYVSADSDFYHSTDQVTVNSVNTPNSRERANDIENKNKLKILLTNARSLAPKISSLITNMHELDISLGIITESWLQDCAQLEQDIKDLELGESIKLICKNRSSKRRPVDRYNSKPKRGGGVVIAFKNSQIELSEFKIEKNKLLVAGNSRAVE